jgi:hypothetical protein
LGGLDVVLQAVCGDGRIGNDHYRLLRGIGPRLAPGEYRVGWVDGEAVLTLGPPLKEPVGGEVPDDALGAVGEVDRVRGEPEQGHGPVVGAESVRGLNKHVLHGGRCSRRLCTLRPGQGIADPGIARAGVVLSRRLACCRSEAARRPMPGLYGAACP